MLVILWSSNLSFSLTAARVAEWRDPDAASRARLVLTDRCTGNVRLVAAGPDRVGTGTGVMTGGGIAGTLAALPMPLGSLTEPFNPRAFAGPGGIPLTPASWAGAGVASKPSTATLMNATLPIVHPREKILKDCARLIVGGPLPGCHIQGEELIRGSFGSSGFCRVHAARESRAARATTSRSQACAGWLSRRRSQIMLASIGLGERDSRRNTS
jgi:hypothetical protein